jgi:5-methylcytosine-specific restriction endonuclease McrA
MLKKCSRCGKEKELNSFDGDKYTKDGFTSQCKECRSEIKKIWIRKPEVRERRKLRARKFRKTLRGRILTKKQNRKLQNLIRFGGLRYIVLERDNYKCFICGNSKKLLVHHIDGKGRNCINPNNAPENLITMCQPCHQKLHIKIKELGRR